MSHECGIHYGMSDADYRAIDLPSCSGLRAEMEPSGKVGAAGSLAFGNVFHMAVLRPGEKAIVSPDDIRRGSKAWSGFAEEHGVDEDCIVRPSEYHKLSLMYRSVRASKYAPLLDADHPREVVVIGEIDGVRVKGMIDQVSDHCLVDWKTTSCFDAADFERSVVKYYYDAQAWLYTELWRGQTGEHRRWRWVCVGKSGDHPVWHTQADDRHLLTGERTVRGWLRRYKAVVEKEPDSVASD